MLSRCQEVVGGAPTCGWGIRKLKEQVGWDSCRESKKNLLGRLVSGCYRRTTLGSLSFDDFISYLLRASAFPKSKMCLFLIRNGKNARNIYQIGTRAVQKQDEPRTKGAFDALPKEEVSKK